MTRFIFAFLLLLLVYIPVQSQTFWTRVEEATLLDLRQRTPDIQPDAYQLFHLSDQMMERHLRRFLPQGASVELTIPLPDGSMRVFEVRASGNIPAALNKKYPDLLGFKGQEVGNPAHIIRGSLSVLGFHAVLQVEGQEVYIDPYQKGQRDYHLVYYTSEHRMDPALREQLGHDHSQFEASSVLENPMRTGPNSPFARLRSSTVPVALFEYDIAIAATGEYTQFWGGKAAALAAINVALDRINFIFVRDAAIELHLVAANDTLIFEDPALDPYTGEDAATLVGENPAVLNERLGASAFDIGHVFTYGCTGTAAGVSGGVGTVCGLAKARGSSCQISTNDRFYIGVICHELGHQFGAFHTWNNCPPANDDPANYNPVAAFEPGSGSTIMSYAGSCQDQNIALSSDAYYHVNSLEAIYQYAREGVGASCAEMQVTENHQPALSIPLEDGFYIPISTPFQLEAEASDPEGAPLTYCWEQYDKDFYLSEIGAPEGNEPIFRSFLPGSTARRYFPRLTDLIRNRTSDSEVLPTYSRDLTFRCTVRDNNETAGGVTWKEVRFKSTDKAGPFVMTTPNDSRMSFAAGEYIEVNWDVANTDQAPVNCQFVNIRLSLDAGLTYPLLLAQNTPNSGTAFVHLPDTSVEFARLMVEAADNIFFDINDFNFEIVPATDTSLLVELVPAGVPLHCQPDDLSFTVHTEAINGYGQPLQLELAGLLPEGSQYTFTPNPVLPGESSTLDLLLAPVDAPALDLEVVGTTMLLDTFRRPLYLSSLANNFDSLQLTTPTDGTAGILLSTNFGWTSDPNVDAYDFELATSPAFGDSIIESAANITESAYQPSSLLAANELYYWRIRPVNACGAGDFLPPSTFHTASVNCTAYSNDTRLNISGTGLPTVRSTIEVTTEGVISDLNIPYIRANYQPVNSLRVTLISPADTRVVLFDQDCGATVNLRLGFDDDAPSAVVCPPDDGIVFQPLNPLAAFIGENTQGTWTLEVAVVRSGFGASGALEEWQLEFCATEQPANPTLLTRDTLYVPPTLRNSITPLELNAIDPAINDNELLYTVVTLPEYGTLTYDGEPLLPGSQFKQRAIDNWLVQYQHHGGDNRFDAFSFVLENGLGGFLPVTTLPIVIDDNAVVGTTAMPRATTELQLFPNPARDAVTLDLAYLSGAAGKVSLLTAQGQVVRHWQQVSSSHFKLPLQGIPAGLYLVRVSNLEGNTRVGRLQVIR